MNQQALAAKLKEFRRDRRLSLRDVQEKTGVSIATLSRFERGKALSDMENLACLAEYLTMPGFYRTGKAIVAYPDSTIDAICEVIRKDEKLTANQAGSLCRFMRACYAEFGK